MSTKTLNLDKVAAEHAQAMVEKTGSVKDVKKHIETFERLVTKALGVLQQQGVYALMLFLFSRTSDEDRIAKKCVLPCLFSVLRLLPSFEDSEGVPEEETGVQEALKFYSDRVTAHLDTLLLVRDLYEQTLIYARYHAKAAGG